MRTRVIKIGNSRGVRIAKPLLEEAGLTDEVDIRVEPGRLVIVSASAPRAGWEEAFRAAPAPPVLDEPTPNRFDAEEWEWK